MIIIIMTSHYCIGDSDSYYGDVIYSKYNTLGTDSLVVMCDTPESLYRDMPTFVVTIRYSIAIHPVFIKHLMFQLTAWADNKFPCLDINY